MVDLARQNWRDYTVDGTAASGKHKPVKSKLRQWGTWVESVINAFTTNGGLIYTTRTLLYADLLHGANTSAWVVSDSTAAYNGIYQKSGISGAGAWTRVADLPYSFVNCADAGAGTANAIVATSTIPAPSTAGAALFLCNVFEANTAAVTLALNGDPAKPVITNSGNALSTGYLVAGMQVVFIDDGTSWRLVSDVASASVLAGAEAAQDAAEAAAAEVALAVSAAIGVAVLANRPLIASRSVTVSAIEFEGDIWRLETIASLPAATQTAITYDNANRQGKYVVSSVDATKVWVRQDRWLRIEHFYLAADGADWGPAFRAALRTAGLDPENCRVDFSGDYEINTAETVIDPNMGTLKRLAYHAGPVHLRGGNRGGGRIKSNVANCAGIVGEIGADQHVYDLALEGFGIADTASCVNADTFTTLGYSIGLLGQMNVQKVKRCKITQWKNAQILGAYSTGATIEDNELMGTNAGYDAGGGDASIAAATSQQFGYMAFSLTYADPALVDFRYGGSAAASTVNLAPHGGGGITVRGNKVGATAIGVCALPGFHDVLIDSNHYGRDLTQHLAYVYAYENHSIINNRGGPNAALIKVSLSGDTTGKHVRNLLIDGNQDFGNDTSSGNVAIIVEVYDKKNPAADPALAQSRFHYLSPQITNNTVARRGRGGIRLFCCMDMLVSGNTIRDIGSGAPQAAIAYENCTGKISGNNISDVYYNAIQGRPAIGGTVEVEGNTIRDWGMIGSGNGEWSNASPAYDPFPWVTLAGACVGTIYATSAGRVYIVRSIAASAEVGLSGAGEPVTEANGVVDGDLTVDYLGTIGGTEPHRGHVVAKRNQVAITRSGLATKGWSISGLVKGSEFDNEETTYNGTALTNTFTGAQMVKHRIRRKFTTVADLALNGNAGATAVGEAYVVTGITTDYVARADGVVSVFAGTTIAIEYVQVWANVRAAAAIRLHWGQNGNVAAQTLKAGSVAAITIEKGFH